MTIHDIEQVNACLSEDGSSVCFYGHTPDEDQTFFWSISLPMPITEWAFLYEEWCEVGRLHWMTQA